MRHILLRRPYLASGWALDQVGRDIHANNLTQKARTLLNGKGQSPDGLGGLTLPGRPGPDGCWSPTPIARLAPSLPGTKAMISPFFG